MRVSILPERPRHSTGCDNDKSYSIPLHAFEWPSAYRADVESEARKYLERRNHLGPVVVVATEGEEILEAWHIPRRQP
jgi:hypothetical protein